MLSSIIHGIYAEGAYNYFEKLVKWFMEPDDENTIRFRNFNTYKVSGKTYTSIHGKSFTLNYDKINDYGLRGWILERIVFMILVALIFLNYNYMNDMAQYKLSDFMTVLEWIYAIMYILRLRQLVIYFLFKGKK